MRLKSHQDNLKFLYALGFLSLLIIGTLTTLMGDHGLILASTICVVLIKTACTFVTAYSDNTKNTNSDAE